MIAAAAHFYLINPNETREHLRKRLTGNIDEFTCLNGTPEVYLTPPQATGFHFIFRRTPIAS